MRAISSATIVLNSALRALSVDPVSISRRISMRARSSSPFAPFCTAISDSREVVSDENEGTLEWVALNRLTELDLVEDLAIIIPRVAAMKPEDAPLFVHLSYDADDQLVMRFAE